jgi:purine-nucleoside phosphorylase
MNRLCDNISKAFFGFNLERSPYEHIIITNIQPVFEKFSSTFCLFDLQKGFYVSGAFNYNNTLYRIIKITPGNVIIDILKIIKIKAKSIILIGLVGALNLSYNIGDIAIPCYVLKPASLVKRRLNDNIESNLTICQVNGLVQTNLFYEKLILHVIDFVDMESFYLYKHTFSTTDIKYIGIVSDRPLIEPFYLKNKNIINFEGILYHL